MPRTRPISMRTSFGGRGRYSLEGAALPAVADAPSIAQRADRARYDQALGRSTGPPFNITPRMAQSLPLRLRRTLSSAAADPKCTRERSNGTTVRTDSTRGIAEMPARAHEYQRRFRLIVAFSFKLIFTDDAFSLQLAFGQVLSIDGLLRDIAMTMSSVVTRALAADLLAAVCVISPEAGTQAVLDALADFQAARRGETRFDRLVDFLRDDASASDDDSALNDWSWRTASLALLNAITASPQEKELRNALRDELHRSGLAEAFKVRTRSSSFAATSSSIPYFAFRHFAAWILQSLPWASSRTTNRVPTRMASIRRRAGSRQCEKRLLCRLCSHSRRRRRRHRHHHRRRLHQHYQHRCLLLRRYLRPLLAISLC